MELVNTVRIRRFFSRLNSKQFGMFCVFCCEIVPQWPRAGCEERHTPARPLQLHWPQQATYWDFYGRSKHILPGSSDQHGLQKVKMSETAEIFQACGYLKMRGTPPISRRLSRNMGWRYTSWSCRLVGWSLSGVSISQRYSISARHSGRLLTSIITSMSFSCSSSLQLLPLPIGQIPRYVYPSKLLNVLQLWANYFWLIYPRFLP